MSLESNIPALFNPQTVAVIGASASPGKVGYSVVANMLDAGFQGTLIPVNPTRDEILGLPTVKTIEALPEGLDLAVIVLPVAGVVPAMEALARRKARAAIVITAGFKEVGGDGAALERRLIEICEANDIAMVGPNCLGLISTGGKVNASFAAGNALTGTIACFSQSGALCTAILDWAQGENVGFSKFVSLGNKAVINEADMLDSLSDDPETSVIVGYLENVEDGPHFMKKAPEVTRKKPVIIIKSGTTAAGAKAASSHTGAIAGDDAAYTAAFRKTGVVRAENMAELFDYAQAFSTQPLPKGPGLAIITNSGGPGAMAADATEKSSLEVAQVMPETAAKLKAVLPAFASVANPIDIIGDAPAERYRKTLEIVAADPNVHIVLVLLSPTASAEIDETAKAVIDVARTSDKPFFVNFMGGLRIKTGQVLLREAGIPFSVYLEPLIACAEAMYGHYLWTTAAPAAYPDVARNQAAARKVIAEARSTGATEIVEFQAQSVLSAYGLPTPQTALTTTAKEAAAAATKIGFPVVLKIASPQISHKSDVGGVKVGLASADEVAAAFTAITAQAARMRPDAKIAGCLVQEMAPKGCKELIIGFKRDPRFGPLLMFGLGGIYVEILKDISFRLAPVTRAEARAMIGEIKSYKLLAGARGEKPVNLQALEDILVAMSQMAMDFPEIVEADFNPVLVNAEKAIVADVRLALSE
ncbi:acetate--CoA ligase family protein [Oleispirillum naphthae]|uniref:acetate--CoA ligase family protein n=1 Tax=Oleispirillum naphthae TaxID=2838853 RepID=UPI00308235DB